MCPLVKRFALLQRHLNLQQAAELVECFETSGWQRVTKVTAEDLSLD